ncbi:FliM/FliN family flagellar motor C-terminal domain-containing protein [Ramlibacter sp. XY19]|uniref:FliM/FliN family flagellar motor C-terminal domain-containing protein n=1 Tax=Ramlibacter paludis TaxID=2908000 RepID=UPI0023D9AB45|nr:FliM/FliN family flagellar motor C-terminal domain-containing protein [Ramlibacter paludis]MCG2594958.1 FliM/FliN family flagellar motor C-terminal domain-containing protein [Ramlibacter paludis]
MSGGRVLWEPWQPGQAARTLHWRDERASQRAETDLRALFSKWCTAWGLDVDGARVRCRSVTLTLEPGSWTCFESEGAPCAWLAQEPEDASPLLRSLFPGSVAHGPLARAVASACRQDLLLRLTSFLGISAAESGGPPPPAIARAGSGALEVEISGVLATRLVMSHELAGARWSTATRKAGSLPSHPLVPATTAMASRALALEVQLDGCELEVGTLRGLQVGDVVRLDHALVRPASLRHGDAALCSAYLGRRDHRKAVELATGVTVQ